MNGTFGCPRKVLAFSLSYCCCCYCSRYFGKRKWYLQLPFPRSLALQIVSKILLVCSESWIIQPQIFSFTSNTFRDVGRSENRERFLLIDGHNLPPPPNRVNWSAKSGKGPTPPLHSRFRHAYIHGLYFSLLTTVLYVGVESEKPNNLWLNTIFETF